VKKSARVLGALLSASFTLAAGSARSEEVDIVAACVQAFAGAQSNRDEDRLRAALHDIEACAVEACPEVVRRKCIAWRGEVELELPTLLVTVVGPAGAPLGDAAIYIDDVLVISDGELRLDPGRHRVRAEREGVSRVEEVTLARGDKRIALELRLEQPAAPVTTAPVTTAPVTTAPVTTAPVTTAPDRGAPRVPQRSAVRVPPDQATSSASLWPVTWIAFAVSGAGLVVGSIAGVAALVRKSELSDACAGLAGCSEEDIDGARPIAHVATAGFVLAGVGAAAGVVSLSLSLSEERETAVVLTPGGALLSLGW
jgi:hypothetical protein